MYHTSHIYVAAWCWGPGFGCTTQGLGFAVLLNSVWVFHIIICTDKYLFDGVFMKKITCRFEDTSWPFWVHDDGDYLSRKLQSKTHGGPGTWEPVHSRAVVQHLRSGDVAIDLGANMGWYTHLMSQAVGPTGRVISLEPNRDNFAVLCANKELNDWHNVTPLEQAAGRTVDRLWLSEPKNTNHGDSRIYHPGDSHDLCYEVPVTDIDSLLHSQSIDAASVRFIKMDCQGAEPHILAGMTNTLARMTSGSAILMEIWPESWNQQPNIDVEAIFTPLESHWLITNDDMVTQQLWPDFMARVRKHFYSTRHVLRGWDVLLTRI